MNATELRVTNFVEHYGDFKPVAMIGYDAVLLYEKRGNLTIQLKLNEINPIPLTKEWLIKFGFKITGQTPHPNDIWTVRGQECKFNLEHIISFFLYDNRCFGTEVKYVHQLQNLFFALTGEELVYSNKL